MKRNARKIGRPGPCCPRKLLVKIFCSHSGLQMILQPPGRWRRVASSQLRNSAKHCAPRAIPLEIPSKLTPFSTVFQAFTRTLPRRWLLQSLLNSSKVNLAAKRIPDRFSCFCYGALQFFYGSFSQVPIWKRFGISAWLNFKPVLNLKFEGEDATITGALGPSWHEKVTVLSMAPPSKGPQCGRPVEGASQHRKGQPPHHRRSFFGLFPRMQYYVLRRYWMDLQALHINR